MKFKHIPFPLLFLVNMVISQASCSSAEPELARLVINNTELFVEIAATGEEKQRGLMHRKNLEYNRGMLFVYRVDQRLSFWMKNTYIPLSIAFISSEGIIREIKNMEPHSLEPVVSTGSVRYALEVNRNFFETEGIKPGDKINFPENFSYTR